MKKGKIFFLFSLFLLLSCQNNQSPESNVVQGNYNLKTSDGILDLSQFSQDQQKLERESAAKDLEILKSGRVVLQHDEKKEIKPGEINLAIFARTSTNIVGEKIYNRNFANSLNKLDCSRFSNSNSAQEFFLKNGGPNIDYHQLDADGDGFACGWNPIIYRQIGSEIDIKKKSGE